MVKMFTNTFHRCFFQIKFKNKNINIIININIVINIMRKSMQLILNTII